MVCPQKHLINATIKVQYVTIGHMLQYITWEMLLYVPSVSSFSLAANGPEWELRALV